MHQRLPAGQGRRLSRKRNTRLGAEASCAKAACTEAPCAETALRGGRLRDGCDETGSDAEQRLELGL